MATATKFLEEECFNVYWKVKNFSYCCENIVSPAFKLSGNVCRLRLMLSSFDIECEFENLSECSETDSLRISFLTCDGSPEESISGDEESKFKVPRSVIFGTRQSAFLPNDILTIRLRCPTDNERGKFSIYSQIGLKRKCFLWTFKDFSKFEGASVKNIERSESYGSIHLRFQSTGGNNPDERFNVKIRRGSGERCFCVLKIQILDKDGKARKEMSDEFTLEKATQFQYKVFTLIIEKRKLLACGNLLLPNDTLTLKCDFSISLGKVSDETTVTSYYGDIITLQQYNDDISFIFRKKSHSNCITELQTNLKSFLIDFLSDVCLQIGSEVIQAHKNILSARSRVFRSMFEKDSKEKVTGTIVIEDLDAETVHRLLLYIYTNTIDGDQWEDIKKLYFAANKYEVLSLKQKCVSFLKTNLSILNVCEALVLADLHRDQNLQSAAIDFISENDSAVFASDQWKDLGKNNASVTIRVLQEICSN